MKSLLTGLMIVLFTAGCAELDIPTPHQVLEKPLGTESIKIGMTKNNILERWGDPDSISFEDATDGGNGREVWLYSGVVSAVPVDAGYLSRSKQLYFDGNNLTKIESL